MDDSALKGLIEAYEAAPSSALGKVIALALADRTELEKLPHYVSGIESALNDEESATLGEALVRGGYFAESLPLLDAAKPEHAVIRAHALRGLGRNEEARECYRSAISANPGVQDAELNEVFDLSARQLDERPRLRVIEKPDPAEVVNMDRYRGETTTFADVVGLDKIKKQIRKKIILPFQKPSLFARFRKKIGGGVLLYGPPGCGKTLLARATAGECNAAFFNIEISDVLDMYIGESERKLHAIFEKARTETPSVVFFDELEALAGKREFSRQGSANNVVSQFLTELDGFSQNNTGVLVLASTNVPWAIDAAFLRPGRFDRMFFVPPPDVTARAGILRHHMTGRPAESNIDFDLLAKRAAGFSGADLANLVEMAADEAIDASMESGSETPIGLDHFKTSLEEARSTTIEWLTTARNYARYANDGGRYNEVVDFLKKHGK